MTIQTIIEFESIVANATNEEKAKADKTFMDYY